MKVGTYFRWMLRESRGARGRMLYFAACLAVGVAAVVGTAALSERIEAGYRERSREILGADFSVDARRPLPEELDAALADRPGLRRADVLETATMVAPATRDGAPARSMLAMLSAVSGPYPLYGEIATDPPGGLARHLADDSVVAARELLSTLGVEAGDEIRVGGGTFRVAAALADEPYRSGLTAFLGPRIYLTRGGFYRTGLLLFGSRIQYRALFALPGNPSRRELDELTERLEKELPGAAYLDFDTHYEVGPGGRRSARRVEGFVGLVALLSLVVGGIGVAQIVKAWLEGRTRAVAVLRCIGVRPGQILVLWLGHTTLLALIGSAVGAAVGCFLPGLVERFAPELVPGGGGAVLPLAAVARGLLLGVGLALAFSLPPLTAIWRVSPARVLRSDAEPLPPNRIVAWSARALLLAGVLGAAWIQSGAFATAVWFTGGFAALVLMLFASARVLIFLAGRLPRGRLHPYLRHGVSALARPGAGTTGAVVALGLGTMVVVATWLVQTRIEEGVRSQIPKDAPSLYLAEVKPEQWPLVEKAFAAEENVSFKKVPVVMARITAVDGRPVEELLAEAEDGGWSRRALTREQRLTWSESLPADNRITAGSLWNDPDRPEVSVEERFARRLGVEVGSSIEFDAGGARRTLYVTSLRTVEWLSLSLNFFLVAEPGALDAAPTLYAASGRLPADAELRLQNRLSEVLPNVTVIRTGPILRKAFDLLERIAAGIGVLGSFTILAGLAILAGAISATSLRRGREVALLKTLGVTRGGVTALFAVEYGLCGALAGAVGAGGALLLAWAFLHHVAELPIPIPVLVLPVAALGCAVLSAVCGVAASSRALRVRPIEALR